MRLFAASVAVIVCEPTVSMVAENVPVPFEMAVLPGRIAFGSLLVNTTVPA